jgi:hypothetical protein
MKNQFDEVKIFKNIDEKEILYREEGERIKNENK